MQVKATTTTEELVRAFKEDDYSTFLLYQSGSFKKVVDQFDMMDKEMLIQEIRDGVLLNSWPAILQLKDGLRHLGVLKQYKVTRSY